MLVGVGTGWQHMSAEVKDYVRHQEAKLEWIMGFLRVLLSCTFLLLLHL